MPYRSELKRPDLKGTFPCSVCGKVFCHSSSLSRHRMQAHFKSYTCTQCNQEISTRYKRFINYANKTGCSGNETLRSHMFRIHSISRMFMCRCCNWAYPDKTSLHIHMQSMLRNGTPGDVSVLARSSSDGPGMAGVVGEMSPGELEGSPSVSPPEACGNESPPSEQTNIKNSLFSNSLLNGSIFPALNSTDNLFRFATKPDNLLSQISTDMTSQNNWLTAWLANSAFSSAPFSSNNLLTVSGNAESLSLRKEGTKATNGTNVKEEMKEDERSANETDISTVKSSSSLASPSKTSNSTFPQDCKRMINGSSLDDLLEKKGLSVTRNHRNKRKASNPQQLRASSTFVTADDEDDEGFVPLPRKQTVIDVSIKTEDTGRFLDSSGQTATTTTANTTLENKKIQNGSALVDASTSPMKKCDCAAITSKGISMTEVRNRCHEKKNLTCESKGDRLDGELSSLEVALRQFQHEKEELKHQIEIFEEILVGYQQSALTALALLQSGGSDAIPAIKKLMENLLQ
ncbi:unnamed protein product [Thelazia callipaeda]|uniref:C2H2-type domain-containing protein n=1 Tax=Thelazia callipaeda TaxID=103827 RepID=A0A0N5CUR0_THECL|nr:unnamed protein product [Thelazia callipaeda]